MALISIAMATYLSAAAFDLGSYSLGRLESHLHTLEAESGTVFFLLFFFLNHIKGPHPDSGGSRGFGTTLEGQKWICLPQGESNHCPLCFSLTYKFSSLGQDALANDWLNIILYAFPPLFIIFSTYFWSSKRATVCSWWPQSG